MPRKKQPTTEQIEQAFILAAMYPSGDSRWGKHAKRLIDTDSIVRCACDRTLTIHVKGT
jgi:hypothetical protein